LTLPDTFARIQDMTEEIKQNGIYTTQEVQKILKISNSTIKRMLKNGLLRANKVGGQYRILGRELLRVVSPDLEKTAAKKYLVLKKKVVSKINRW
jgi:excisionase family DNA binding protein